MADTAARPAARGTRERIIDAAMRLMDEVGLVRTTTKEIARAAGCSEAALYKHFRDKEEIFLHVLHERLPALAQAVADLPGRAGQQTVAEHLTEVAELALGFYSRSFPMAASLYAAPELLAAHRERTLALGGGPQNAPRQLTAYLRAEQELGRLAPEADPEAAAALLLGACFHHAFLRTFLGEPYSAERDAAEARRLVHSLLAGVPAGQTQPRVDGIM